LEPSLLSAAELVESAIVEGKEDMAVPAAQRIVLQEPNAVPLLRKQARSLLERTGHADQLPEEPAHDDFKPIRFWRSRTRLNPTDALAWVELSLNHTINGALRHAERDMRTALFLAPTNRHVLRSAARLFLHLNDVGRAHELLLRSPATRGDPWLMAAEISISEVAGKSSAFAKQGRQLLEGGGLAPRLITELAGALATRELIEGAHKRSKKLFVQSMIDPTGNALAQAEWATPLAGSPLVPAARLSSVREASEAQAFHAFMAQKYQLAVPACETWANEEPFSIRPFEFGSSVAGLAGDYDKGLDFAMRGLEIRPGAPKLVNSMAFCLASKNEPLEAARALDQADWSAADAATKYVAEANRGLIAFRRGDFAEGRARYSEAELGFIRIGDRQSAASSKAYRAREECLAGLDEASAALEEARKAWTQIRGNIPHPALQAANQHLLERQAAAPSSPDRTQPSWSLRTVISHGASTSPRRLPPALQGGTDEDRS
jgi:tetratricopeptide (TPR) repeat protein